MLSLVEPKEICLRGYQADAIEGLRKHIRAGKKRLILCAGTGAGKTLTSAHLLKEAARKGSYSLFIVDRVALVDQTSEVFDQYGLRHGIVQGINDRWMPHEHIQVCSAQTLARRALPRDPSLIVVDECHAQYRATLDYMAKHPDAVKVGLTATPFTAGMGKHWDAMVNVRSTRLLIGDGHLVEPTIFVAKSPEDAEFGLNSYGEFSDESASSAGIRIVGDVVQEWVKKTQEHFGGPVKTLVFSPTVEHGREVCAAFAAAGFNFQQISYLDRSDAERADKIAEFRRPDSIIHGLVSCGVLTKGFDVTDCMVGISCKPYRKSLSSHMQEIGRIMRPHPGKTKALWLCLARDSKILTDRGLIPIQFVTRHDKVWDGENYVSHGGTICKGIQHVITYQGLTATPGHLVHTVDGWRTFGECAREQIAITQTGSGGTAIRLGQDRFARRAVAWAKTAPLHSRRLRVRGLWLSVGRVSQQLAEWAHQGLSNLQPACAGISHVALLQSAGAETPVHQPEQCQLGGLWRPRDQVQLPRRESGGALDHGESWHPGGPQAPRHRPDRPGWTLRAREYPLASSTPEPSQQIGQSGVGQGAYVPSRTPRGSICRRDIEAPVLAGNDECRDSGEIQDNHVLQTYREVWDILDAGPNNRFTCEGLLVHNCHSGNIERFALDMFDVWENGAGDLSKAEKRDSKPRERNEETRKASVCPECSGALRGNFCMACGWERPARSGIVAVEGTLHEFKAADMTARAGLRAECLKDPRKVWDACLAYCLDHCARDEGKARRWSYGVWRGIYPEAKLPGGWFDATRRIPDVNAYALVDREVRRFRKSRRAA